MLMTCLTSDMFFSENLQISIKLDISVFDLQSEQTVTIKAIINNDNEKRHSSVICLILKSESSLHHKASFIHSEFNIYFFDS